VFSYGNNSHKLIKNYLWASNFWQIIWIVPFVLETSVFPDEDFSDKCIINFLKASGRVENLNS
jgi:hypothetical protein